MNAASSRSLRAHQCGIAGHNVPPTHPWMVLRVCTVGCVRCTRVSVVETHVPGAAPVGEERCTILWQLATMLELFALALDDPALLGQHVPLLASGSHHAAAVSAGPTVH